MFNCWCLLLLCWLLTVCACVPVSPCLCLCVCCVMQGWDHVVAHTPEQTLKTAKWLVAASIGISVVASFVDFEDE